VVRHDGTVVDLVGAAQVLKPVHEVELVGLYLLVDNLFEVSLRRGCLRLGGIRPAKARQVRRRRIDQARHIPPGYPPRLRVGRNPVLLFGGCG